MGRRGWGWGLTPQWGGPELVGLPPPASSPGVLAGTGSHTSRWACSNVRYTRLAWATGGVSRCYRRCELSPQGRPARLPGARPLTFTSETDGKHRLVGRCLMVATLDSTATLSAVRDGLEAGTISSGLSAT